MIDQFINAFLVTWTVFWFYLNTMDLVNAIVNKRESKNVGTFFMFLLALFLTIGFWR